MDNTNVPLIQKSCVYCKHCAVCGIYDAFMDADLVAVEYGILALNYDNSVYNVLADNCTQYSW
jgi:hypothetical protein